MMINTTTMPATDVTYDALPRSNAFLMSSDPPPNSLRRANTVVKPSQNTLALSCRPRFLARDSICAKRATCYRNSVCPSHGWISQKRLKLGSCNFRHTVAPSFQFLPDKLHPEILTSPP